MATLPEDVSVDIKVAIDELESAITEVESRLESTRAERDETKAREVELEIENAGLRRELSRARGRQNASAEILRTVASASGGDAEGALHQIAETTARLFGAPSVTILLAEGWEWGKSIHFGATSHHIRDAIPAEQRRLDGDNLPGTVYRENRQVHIPDLDHVDPAMAHWPVMAARADGTRTVAGTPLRREGKAIGALLVYRDGLAPFTDEELALQQSFADQAVIAIENARLFNETREALERQTATADILNVIASSPSDVQPVFDAIAASGRRLVGGFSTSVFSIVDDILHLSALTPTNPSADAALKASFPRPLSGEPWNDRVRNGETVEIADIETDPIVPASLRETWRARGFRSLLLVPLVRSQTTIGVISATRVQPGTFASHHVQLFQTFADQAVIAIENARLFNETQEALERQTATSEILKVIAGSPSDVQPVFDVIVERAVQLCGARMGRVYRYDGDLIQLVGGHGLSAPGRDSAQRPFPRPASDDTIVGRVMLSRKPNILADLNEDDTVPPLSRQMIEAIGARSQVTMPMLLSGEPIGAITLSWAEPRGYTDQQIVLLQTFADQAVIAIENTRLFNETREALEQQKASADILRAISSSVADTRPAFDKILDSCKHLFGSDETAVLLVDDEGVVTLGAYVGKQHDAVAATFPAPVDKSPAGHAIRERRVVHYTDVANDPQLTRAVRHVAQIAGYEAMAYAPMMWNERGVGAIGVSRLKGAFSDKELALLQTFADQAVIAIQNARLFNETREALERQTATAEVLKVIASSPSDVQPVFGAIASSAKRLLGAFSTTVLRFIGDELHLVAYTPTDPAADEALRTSFPRPLAEFPTFALVRDGATVQFPDTEADDVPLANKELGRLRGFRSVLFTPLMSQGTPVGIISVTRAEPGAFIAHHVQLLQTFADQAVIAIENVRLFNETQEALERQTATAEILKVIASSPSDVQPVFDAIAHSANRLIGGFSAAVFRYVGGKIHLAAFTPTDAAGDAVLQSSFPAPPEEFPPYQLTREGAPAELPDTDLEPAARDIARARGYRSMLFAPLMNDGEAVGIITVTRVAPGPFGEQHVRLLQMFADQAVIAIENVRLFDEVQAKTRDLEEALQQQTATADVLKVISRSAFDLEAVMNTLARSASELCGADMSGLFLRENDQLIARGVSDVEEQLENMVRQTPVPIDDQTYMGRSVLTGEITNLGDVDSGESNTRLLAFQKAFGYKSLLVVPLLREGRGVGVFALVSNSVGAFSQRQIDLVQTFADQAVIAIENVRLFDEVQAKTRDLTEALTYQTGSANILRVIASSPTDVAPVLKAIVDSAVELCDAYDAIVLLRDGDFLRFSEHHGPIPIGFEKWPINRRWTAGRAFVDRKAVHLRDLLSDEGDDFPDSQELARQPGHRSILSVPLLRENESIGVIALRRIEVQPFSDKQIALLQTFADQAVIAIGNVRLFDEVQAKTRDLTEALTYQTGSANILSVIASSPTDVAPALRAIVESACELCEANDALVALKEDNELVFQAQHGSIPVVWDRQPIDRAGIAGPCA
jgi:GAF domain-containing protein